MTRTQAWRKVAELFDTAWEERSRDERNWTSDGLCWAFQKVSGLPHEQTYAPMDDLRRPLGLPSAWWWPRRGFDFEPHHLWTPECDADRATFAALMAAMTQRERDQLVKGL